MTELVKTVDFSVKIKHYGCLDDFCKISRERKTLAFNQSHKNIVDKAVLALVNWHMLI